VLLCYISFYIFLPTRVLLVCFFPWCLLSPSAVLVTVFRPCSPLRLWRVRLARATASTTTSAKSTTLSVCDRQRRAVNTACCARDCVCGLACEPCLRSPARTAATMARLASAVDAQRSPCQVRAITAVNNVRSLCTRLQHDARLPSANALHCHECRRLPQRNNAQASHGHCTSSHTQRRCHAARLASRETHCRTGHCCLAELISTRLVCVFDDRAGSRCTLPMAVRDHFGNKRTAHTQQQQTQEQDAHGCVVACADRTALTGRCVV